MQLSLDFCTRVNTIILCCVLFGQVVQNFFFGLLIKLTPEKCLGVENDRLNDENYVFVRPRMYVCPY